MNKLTSITATALLLASLAGLASVAAERKPMPKEDVVDVPAVGQGLCVANIFQSNMVLQRDKPLNIWGWAEPGEGVIVVFAGQEVQARAAADRAWQVTLQPIPANRVPQTMTVKGKSTTLTLENVLVGDVWILGGQSNMEFTTDMRGRETRWGTSSTAAGFPWPRSAATIGSSRRLP